MCDASPSLQYRPKVLLDSQHTDSVNALAFSRDGRYIASCGSDGLLIVWCIQSGEALHRVDATKESPGPLLSLVWAQCGAENIISGSQDGSIITISLDNNMINSQGFVAHSKPVEYLSLWSSPDLMVSGAHNEVKVWRSGERDMWKEIWLVPEPAETAYSSRMAVIVTSVHWLNVSSEDAIIVTYLYHGIVCWNTMCSTARWTIPLPSCAASSFSAPYQSLVISTLSGHFDVYQIGTGVKICTFSTKQAAQARKILPVLFIHEGQAVVSGSAVGQVKIWDPRKGEKIQTLKHSGEPLVQALASHCHKTKDAFLIASATAESGQATYVQIWEAVNTLEDSESSTNQTVAFAAEMDLKYGDPRRNAKDNLNYALPTKDRLPAYRFLFLVVFSAIFACVCGVAVIHLM
ncbi:WD40 repeat-like protein [Rickenella mellea]|uniref:WD40 repeat-like protein n=1 Tax=Rickenella mellea TaxID=50990 RepID=A0A4Y7PX60_9AGAM|nr:WD40 repeat-like protein [Rickenella mellea]